MKDKAKIIIEQKFLEKIQSLEPQYINELMDFIDFLTERKSKRSPFIQSLIELPVPKVSLR